MAKNDNLKDFLTDVADAIREKKGTTDLINPQDFSAEIASIQSGGGAVAVSAKAVNFRDYDGTILHSYTKDEFLALTELPPLPTREGLICQEWNWDFADAVEYVTEYGVLEVGATYITDDGKTRLYITIAAEGRMDVPLYFYQSVANGVTIDWGDGSATETLSGAGHVNTTHHYNAIGDYMISLDVADGGYMIMGRASSSYSVMGATSNQDHVYRTMLKRVEMGKNTESINNTFRYCYSLTSVVIPNNVTSNHSSFANCYSLGSIVFPKGTTQLGNTLFNYCYSLTYVSIPNTITSMGGNVFDTCPSLRTVIWPKSLTSILNTTFDSCYSLASVVIPQNITSIGNYAFNACRELSSVVLPQGITKIGTAVFQNCQSLASVVIPQGVTKIENNAFNSCYGMAFYDFSALESVPTLSATNAFSSIPSDCKIIVPDALYDEWIAATNWSTYASQIIKKSEWDALNA